MKRTRLCIKDYTVGWICALPIELAAAAEMLDEEHQDIPQYSNDTNLYTLGRISEHNVVIACLPAGQMGTNSAAAVASQMKSKFVYIKFSLMVGIGGGVPSEESDIRLGDVVISQPQLQHGGVVQYDFGKAGEGGKFTRTGSLNAPPAILLNALSKSRSNHLRHRSNLSIDLSTIIERLPNFATPGAKSDVLFETTYNHIRGPTCDRCSKDKVVERDPRKGDKIFVHYGTIASGNQVMKDGVTRDNLSLELGGVLCFEMEAAGLMNNFPCLIIRGICDYADSHKNKKWQPYAAATAAVCAKELLSIIPPAEVEETFTAQRSVREQIQNTFEYKGNISNQAGQQTIHGNMIITHVSDEDLLKLLPSAAQAAFNSYDKRHDPLCLHNTRVDVLQEIMAWADGDDERCIFWMNGMAGTGKSTIARTVARTFYDQKRLGASFFFSRGGGDAGHSGRLVTSIAVQLAEKSIDFKRIICEAITEQSNIASRNLRDQWNHLIQQPLSKIKAISLPSPLILVIDALDECEGDNDIQIILQLFTEAQSLADIGLRVFLTSRPETPIRLGFRAVPKIIHHNLVLHDVCCTIIDHDISIFFQRELSIIKQERAYAADWPGEETIKRLVQSAAGLFIWAATTCRFISGGKGFAARRLSRILQGDNSVAAPEERLNEIYIEILKNSISYEYDDQEKEKLCKMLKAILGTIVILLSSLSTVSLARLLHIPKMDIDQTLNDLHSILRVPKDQDHPIGLHHPSFRDFLLDKQRCRDQHFWVNEKEAHGALAESCLQLMSSNLRKDICDLRAPGTRASEVDSYRVEQSLPADLQYACRYWVQHLQRSEVRLYDNGKVYAFLQEHLLHWLEALSLTGKTNEGVLAITSLESIAIADKSPSLQEFIYHAKRFALKNRSIIEKAPLQIYYSALVFAPEKSLVRKLFEHQMSYWIQRLPEVQEDWSPLLQTLEGHASFVSAIAFSPDGRLLASASGDETVRIWDPAAGAVLQRLEGHVGSVKAVAFSPDGRQLASASDDRTVRIWDPAAGAVLQRLEGHVGSVKAVAFSPDGRQLVSVSYDSTVRIWDPATSVALQTLEGHVGSVNAVAFSPDSKQLALASDETVRIWDSATGTVLQTLEGHVEWITTIELSPDSKLASVGSNIVRLCAPPTGAALQTLRGHVGLISSIAFSPDGKLLASASYDMVRLWDLAIDASLQTLEVYAGPVKAVAFSPDGKQLALASYNTVKLWDLATGMALATISINIVPSTLSFSSDGLYLNTDKELINISSPSLSPVSPQLNPQQKMVVKRRWVAYGVENFLWLPSEYRATCSAVRSNMLALGHASGCVTFFEFDLANIPCCGESR